MADLKKFRHSVSVLKKQGLITGTTAGGQPLDARSVLPSWKIKGKTLGSLVKKYDDVASGKATALPVSPSKLKQFRKSGFETAAGRVIIPHSATEKARVERGEVVIKSVHGIERVQIPVEFQDLKQYFSDIRKNAKPINALKRKNEYFGIRFYGGQRANFYSDIQALLDDLSRYEAMLDAKSRIKQQEIYKNLEIIRIDRRAALKIEQEIETRKKQMSARYNREHQKKLRKKIKKSPTRLAAYRAASAERSKSYRARLKGRAKTEYKKAAIRRRKKASKKAKKKK